MTERPTPGTIEAAVMVGDLSDLTTEQRSTYYQQVCESLGLNPLTKPFEYLTLNGKLRLYALRDCTDQLRRIHGISIYIANRERMGDIYIITARAKDRTGREDESTGAVALGNLKGDALANALMKCETKAKRRVTLSIAGLGWLDETELATIPGVQTTAPVMPHETTGMSPPLPVGEEGTPGAATPPATNGHRPVPKVKDPRMTDEAIAALFHLALDRCGDEKEAFGTRVRRAMGVSADVKINKKFVATHLSPEAYTTVYGWYETLYAQLQRKTEVPPHATIPRKRQHPQPRQRPQGRPPRRSLLRPPYHLHQSQAQRSTPLSGTGSGSGRKWLSGRFASVRKK
jgi:hypothetical protein